MHPPQRCVDAQPGFVDVHDLSSSELGAVSDSSQSSSIPAPWRTIAMIVPADAGIW